MTCARSAAGLVSYHSQNPARPSGSSRSATNGARNCLLFSSGGTRARVASAVPHQGQARHA